MPTSNHLSIEQLKLFNTTSSLALNQRAVIDHAIRSLAHHLDKVVELDIVRSAHLDPTYTLERLIEEQGLKSVIAFLSDICNERASSDTTGGVNRVLWSDSAGKFATMLGQWNWPE